MKRSGRSRSRRKPVNLRRILTSPLTPALLGLAVVLGVGYWVMRGAGEPTDSATHPGDGTGAQAGAQPGSQTGAQPGMQAGAQSGTPSGSPPASQPGSQSADQPDAEPAAEPATQPEAEPGAGAAAPDDSEPAAQPGAAPSRSQIDRSGGAAESMLITVYYADGQKNGESLQPVEIKVPLTVSRIAVTVEQLLNPPTELGLHSNFPPGTSSLPPNLVDGVAIVELSPEAEAVRGSAAVNTMIASLVYSLTEIPEVNAVQLRVGGRPAVLDGFEWSRPISRADLEARNLFRVEPVLEYSGS